MNTRLPVFAVVSVLLALMIGLSGAKTVQAQISTLPDGWCQQTSSERLTSARYPQYSQTIGNSEGGIRAVYQPYNSRIVLQSTDPREVVQVIETGVDLSHFEPLRYTANCRYLVAVLRDTHGQYSTVVYDLTDSVAIRMGAVPNSGLNWRTIQSSPDGTYLLVTALDGLHLWNLSSNTQTDLTALARFDCDFVQIVGCSGVLYTYREARWDVPHGLLQLDLITNYTITLNLPDATINQVEATPRYSYHIPVVSSDQLASAAIAFTSDYACVPRVQYQTYNRRVVLLERYTHQLVAVVEDNLDLSGFQFLGWSATCNYIAAAIEDENGLRLVAWTVNDMVRHEHSLTDWVDQSSWASAGDTISIVTDGGSFEWDLNGS